MHKYVFVDTNVFEQFQPLENIDWIGLACAEELTLVIPSITLRQLNQHKDGAGRGRIKKRAANALSLLSKYSRQECGFPRANVHLSFRHQEPVIDFPAYHLNKDIADDWLIASAIEFADEQNLPAESVAIATDDLGLELKVKACHSVTLLRLPSDLRLPPEIDPEEARIKELENEIRVLRNSVPRLALSFENGASSVGVAIESALELLEDKVEGAIVELQRKHPPLELSAPQPLSLASFLVDPTVSSKYNMELNEFIVKTRHYYSDMVNYFNRARLTVHLTFCLQNTGNAPADDIDIQLHFPDGVTVLDEDDEEKEPKAPKPPLKPEERFAQHFAFPNIALPRYEVPNFTPRTLASTRLTGIKKTNSYLVTFVVARLKHTMTEELPAVRFRFDSFERVKPFGIEYTIVAANLPKPSTGKLDVIANSSNADNE